MLPDDWNLLSWGDILAAAPVLIARDRIELFLDDLLSSRQSVSSAHSILIIADRS
jgi:hypothetical protein